MTDDTTSKASGNKTKVLILGLLVIFTLFNGIIFYVIPNMHSNDVPKSMPPVVTMNNANHALTYGTEKATNFFENKCIIQKFDPNANVYAKNCSYDEMQDWLINNTKIHMRGFEIGFFNDLAIGNENIGIQGDSLFGGAPFGFFIVKFTNGTSILFGNYNNTDIYPFYTQEMAKICNHKCQNGDLP